MALEDLLPTEKVAKLKAYWMQYRVVVIIAVVAALVVAFIFR